MSTPINQICSLIQELTPIKITFKKNENENLFQGLEVCLLDLVVSARKRVCTILSPTWLFHALWQIMHRQSNEWHMKKTIHILTHGTMQGCELTSLVVCINGKTRDTRERNVTMSEIWTKNIHSLGSRDTREWVTLWRLMLWSLGCESVNETIPIDCT